MKLADVKVARQGKRKSSQSAPTSANYCPVPNHIHSSEKEGAVCQKMKKEVAVRYSTLGR